MMQGLHHQQQQLAALLTVALPKDDPSKSTSSTSTVEDDESSRVAAITSLQRAILYPPNSVLITHPASFLARGFSQLLSDKSYSVRQAAATAYGALCSVLCLISIAPNGRHNSVILGSLVDRFIGWALPLLSTVVDGSTDLALEGLLEFLNVGDVAAVERFALPIIKACQELLEDERTSLSLLRRLLAPHFVDVVDLLLGWAMVPDLAESDRRVIMDSFLQFQKYWVNNMQFPLGLLSKFLGDKDVLLQDASPVLQSTASGLLEMNMLEQISEPLCKMVPILLGCISMIGKKFGWSKWNGHSWRCLTLLAEILSERFATFYPIAVISYQSMRMKTLDSFQVHGVLKTNLQLLSLQKLGLFPSSVHKILQFDAPISQVVEKSMIVLEELDLLRCMLGQKSDLQNPAYDVKVPKSYSKSELFALIKFDLGVLISCVSLGNGAGMIGQMEIDTLYVNRSGKLISSIIGNFNLSITILKTLERLAAVEFLSKCSHRKQVTATVSQETSPAKLEKVDNGRTELPGLVLQHLKMYAILLIRALHVTSSLAVKIEALQWIHAFCRKVVDLYENEKGLYFPYEVFGYADIVQDLLFSVLDVASDREPKLRSLVALVLHKLLQAKLIQPTHFIVTTQVVLEKLSDPDEDIRNAFVRLLSNVLPITVYACGLRDNGVATTCWPGVLRFNNSSNMHWKQLFALKQLPQQLHSQQLVNILSYIAQRWKVPLLSWIQRLICSCGHTKVVGLIHPEETSISSSNGLLWNIKVDENILERICSVNTLAGAWWAIHEAARYCITTRLRTNLGGPSQTFAALEKVPEELEKAKGMLMEPLPVFPLDGLVEAASHVNQLYCISAFEECYKLNVSHDKHFPSLLSSHIQAMKTHIIKDHQDCNIWNLMSLARKQKNFRLANHLHNYLKDHLSSFPDGSIRDHIILGLEYERVLLMHAEDKFEDSLTSLWSFIRPSMISSSFVASDTIDKVLKAKACLKLSNWLQEDYSHSGMKNIALKIRCDFNSSPGTEESSCIPDNLTSKETVSAIIEELVGTATKLSSQLCPTLGKSWISYASWCYNQARSSLRAPSLFSCSKLRESRFCGEVLNEDGDSDVFCSESSESMQSDGAATSLLQEVVDTIEAEAGAPGVEDYNGEFFPNTLTSKLQQCLFKANVVLEEENVISLISDLVNIWWSLRRRRVSLFGHAAQAFMNFLSYASSRSLDGQLTGCNEESKYKSVNYTLRSTLYVLHILLNYGVELKDTLEPALSTVPLLTWQLFARLSSNPEQAVRKHLETLLVKLAKLSPRSVVYPTLVDANSYERESSEELQKILACLNQLYPKLVQDVKLMITELENVTVLWEELWLSTLQDLHADVMRRINFLKEEAARIAENPTLSHGEKNKINAAKYSAMMAPIVVVLERHFASTSRKPETPHEIWFHEVAILSTKTKPKKIVIVGSNGEKYTYLLKGREDLRLDARIMQLLESVSNFLNSSSAVQSRSVGVRFYSWVDNVVSIYSVSKAWQSRVQLAQLSALAYNAKQTVPPPVPRPMDMFYGKIIPALMEKGIRRILSGSDWPHEETPKQLLYQELWCSSEGFKAFSSKLKRYSGSVAAMSIIGHVLGLGDRHSDNIPMDFCSGDIVHIDYNVCFDKGQRLKVPEIVPFCLTQTIEAALGLTGIEGTFRANCEAVLKKNKDIILMLLEVFFWDPLERKGMDLAVSLSLFASRMQEIRIPLQEHHDLLLSTLPAVESGLEYEVVSGLYRRADQERSNLVLRETSAKSLVADTTSTSENIRASLEIQARELAQAQALVMEKAQEATNWIEQHGRTLDALRSSSIPDIRACIKLTGKEESISCIFVPEPTQAQCNDIDREVSHLVAELDHGLSSVISTIQTYSLALQLILPINYHTSSPVHGWSQVLQLAIITLSSDILSLSRRQAAELIGKAHADGIDSVKNRYDDLCIKVEECAELINSVGPETELRAKNSLLSAFKNYVESTGLERKEDAGQLGASVHGGSQDGGLHGSLQESKEKVLSVLKAAFSSLYQYVSMDYRSIYSVVDTSEYLFDSNWTSIFKSSLFSCKNLVGQMVEVVLPEVIRSVILFNTEVMDVFASLTQIRRSIDIALEQLIEVELERASLAELEQNYQLSLKEASVKGRDHLSWEEAEELASQEEACRAQLDKLHQSWNQKDVRTSSLIQKEDAIRSSLEHHLFRSRVLMAALMQPFSELEAVDRELSLLGAPVESGSTRISLLKNLSNSGCPVSEYIWKLPGIWRNHAFFVWKFYIVDSFLDSCTQSIALQADQSLGFDQLVNIVKKKLESQLQENVEQYIEEKVAPVLITWLEKESECLKRVTESTEDLTCGQRNNNFVAVRNVQMMLEDSKSAASLMKRQVCELKEALLKTSLEIVQFEWMHDINANFLQKRSLISHKYLSSDARLVPGLQACERTSVTAEGQLERAMSWAIGGASSTSAGNTLARNPGIPQEFHDHLMRHVMKLCISILKFELSRDGFFQTSEEFHPARSIADGRTWQQAYLNALINLDISYHSFTHTEQEWKLAQSNMEAASSGLFSATNELCVASVKAKSTSGDLQSTLLEMRDCSYELSVALSALGPLQGGVLAVTEGVHDVHSIANDILLPLESLLCKDVATMTEAMTKEREATMEISPVHGQAIFQSYHVKVEKTYEIFKPLVQSLTISVEELYSILTRLSESASLHAGNLHKGWISTTDSMTSGSSESAATSSQVSLANSSNVPDLTHPITPYCSDETERREYSHNFSSVGSSLPGLAQPESEKTQETFEMKLLLGNEEPLSSKDKVQEAAHETSLINVEAANRTTRGKNTYALSILRRVEMKEISIAEQVDYLLKQATSVDNLCNMYEVWAREFEDPT
ncbi:unnamed protein product [Withania somnifera]